MKLKQDERNKRKREAYKKRRGKEEGVLARKDYWSDQVKLERDAQNKRRRDEYARKKGEEKQALEELEYWRRVGRIIKSEMVRHWSGFAQASFTNPPIIISGYIARILLKQQNKIERLEQKLKEAKEAKGAKE